MYFIPCIYQYKTMKTTRLSILKRLSRPSLKFFRRPSNAISILLSTDMTLWAYFLEYSTSLAHQNASAVAATAVGITAMTNGSCLALPYSPPDLCVPTSTCAFEPVVVLFGAELALGLGAPEELETTEEEGRRPGCEPVVSFPSRRTATNSWCAVAMTVIESSCTTSGK